MGTVFVFFCSLGTSLSCHDLPKVIKHGLTMAMASSLSNLEKSPSDAVDLYMPNWLDYFPIVFLYNGEFYIPRHSASRSLGSQMADLASENWDNKKALGTLTLCMSLYVDVHKEVLVAILAMPYLFQLQLSFIFSNSNTACLGNISICCPGSLSIPLPAMRFPLETELGQEVLDHPDLLLVHQNGLLFFEEDILEDLPAPLGSFAVFHAILPNRLLNKLNSISWKSIVVIFLLFCSVFSGF